MNNLDRQYLELCDYILRFGNDKLDRTCTGTKSIFGWQIRHRMEEGFPLLTTKKVAWKQIVSELLWFLQGRTDLKYLLDNDNHIWVGDAYKRYTDNWIHENPPFSGPYERMLSKEDFINKIQTDNRFNNLWGDLGAIYGKQWRDWNGVDQIANLIHDLKTNPDSRRMMVNAWNVSELNQMVLPPCHYGFQVYTRKLNRKELNILYSKRTGLGEIDPKYDRATILAKDPNIPRRSISLMFNMRSTDVGLGLPFNLASYGLLLTMLAKQVNMIPDELVYNGGDVHLYSNHIEPIKEQLTRIPYKLSTVKLSDKIINDISEYSLDDIILENYQYHPSIKIQLSN